jgi:hypothetical protein
VKEAGNEIGIDAFLRGKAQINAASSHIDMCGRSEPAGKDEKHAESNAEGGCFRKQQCPPKHSAQERWHLLHSYQSQFCLEIVSKRHSSILEARQVGKSCFRS